MEMIKSKTVIAFFALVLVVSYISALDGAKTNSASNRSNLISNKSDYNA